MMPPRRAGAARRGLSLLVTLLAALAGLGIQAGIQGGARAVTYGADDRVAESRDPGTPYGAIGLLYHHEDGGGYLGGTAFLVSPCHVLTNYHVAAHHGRRLSESETSVFYLGQGQVGPDWDDGQHFSLRSAARPVVWGNFLAPENEGDDRASTSAAAQNGWEDWALLKLDDCLGDAARGFGYLRLQPIPTRELTRSQQPLAVTAVGLPADKSTAKLWADPDCRIYGQISASGWQHDCLFKSGNSGGPLFAIDPQTGTALVYAVGASRPVMLGLADEKSDAVVIAPDDPDRLSLLPTAVPVAAFLDRIAPYLPADPARDVYLADHPHDEHYTDLGDERMIADLDAALKANPKATDAYILEGRAYDARGRHAMAITQYSAALAQNPKDWAALYHRCLAWLDVEDFAAAVRDCSAVLAAYPDRVDVLIDRGKAYYYDSDFEAAIADYSAAIKGRPRLDYAYSYRADAYAAMDRFKEAIIDYGRAIRLAEGNAADAYYNRGYTRLRLGQYGAAIADFRSAIEQAPDAAEVYRSLALAEIADGDADAAKRALDTAVRQDPNDAWGLLQRGNLAYAANDFTAALADYQAAIGSDRLFIYPQLMRFLAQARLGQDGSAELRAFIAAREAADAKPDEWPMPIARYFAGTATEQQVRDGAKAKSAQMTRDQTFDADFYLGQLALIGGDRAKAADLLKATTAEGFAVMVEYGIASAELARM